MSRGPWYAIVVLFLTTGIGLGTTLVYASQIDRNSNKEWCELLMELDDAYSTTPPTTELGRKVATAINHLHEKFC